VVIAAAIKVRMDHSLAATPRGAAGYDGDPGASGDCCPPGEPGEPYDLKAPSGSSPAEGSGTGEAGGISGRRSAGSDWFVMAVILRAAAVEQLWACLAAAITAGSQEPARFLVGGYDIL
jgi:hypothetical protein